LRRLKSAIILYAPFFFIGIAVLLIVGIGSMVYLNNYFLVDKTAYTAKIIKVSAGPAYKTVPVDSGAQNETCSYDGQYLAYLSGGTVKIADIVGGTTATVTNPDGMQAQCLHWNGDTDDLAIAEYTPVPTDYSYVNLFSYVAQTNTLEILPSIASGLDPANYGVISARFTDAGSTVTALDVSAFTGKTWFKITDSKGQSTVWTLSTLNPDDLDRIIKTKNIGSIGCLQNEDEILYEDKDDGKVYAYDAASTQKAAAPIAADGQQAFRLLGIDINDTVYLAAGGGGKIDSIYTGNIASGKWNSILLGTSTDLSDIEISYDGKVFLNNPVSHSIIELSADSQSASSAKSSKNSSVSSLPKSVQYKGTLIGMCDGGFLCDDNGNVTHYQIN
jgi:hypothetical protein